MMDRCDVSIIMSVYNGERYLADAIESIIQQTYQNWELLITDDASTDETTRIIQNFAEKDERIKPFYNIRNCGLTQNLNTMILKSTGRYIARLDADDIALENRIDEQFHFLENHPDVHMVCSWGESFGTRSALMKTPRTIEGLAAQLIFSNPIIHSSVMFRKDTHFLYDEHCLKAQDTELWSRMIENGKGIAPLNKVLIKYRYHDNQISAKSSKEQETVGNLTRTRMLKKIGLNPDVKELDVYFAFLNRGEVQTAADVLIIDDILLQIQKLNLQQSIFDHGALKKAIRSLYGRLFVSVKKNNIKLELNRQMVLLYRSISIDTVKQWIYEMREYFFR